MLYSILLLKINNHMHEIKINRASGQQSCPLISGLHVLSMSTTTSWFLKAMSCSIIARYIYWIVTGMQLMSIVFVIR